ncbi:MAG: hypothetical protein ACAH80_02555 [Alphaproteobacteria bacterium]
MRNFSLTAVILGLILIVGGMVPLAINVKTRMAATPTTLEVVSKRESTCRFSRKRVRRDPCAYPLVVHVDESGKKHFFELKPWRTEKLRWELKKSKNQLEVFYLHNGPSPDDDEIFEYDSYNIYIGFLCSLLGACLLWMECHHRNLRRAGSLQRSAAG